MPQARDRRSPASSMGCTKASQVAAVSARPGARSGHDFRPATGGWRGRRVRVERRRSGAGRRNRAGDSLREDDPWGRKDCILGRQRQNARVARTRLAMSLLDEVFVGVKAGVAEPGHDTTSPTSAVANPSPVSSMMMSAQKASGSGFSATALTLVASAVSRSQRRSTSIGIETTLRANTTAASRPPAHM
jgi:hypothetical protein